MITRRQIEKNCFGVALMMPQRLLLAIVVLLSLACVAAAHSTEAATEKWEAPPDAAAKANPEARNPGAPAAGRKLFQACVNCHGEDGRGGSNTGAADLRRAETQGQSDGALFWKITHGNTANGMPSFAALPEAGSWDIVTFLRTLKEGKRGKESTRDGSGASQGREKGAVH